MQAPRTASPRIACLMRLRLHQPLHHLVRAGLLLLALACAQAFGRGVESLGAPLVVSVDHVVPEYKGGEKFRSPPTIDTALVEDLARRLALPLSLVGAQNDLSGAPADAGEAAVRVTTLSGVAAVPPTVAAVPIGYRAAPMAIMRSDTSIRRWDELRNRSVCVALGGNHVGTVAPRYGAIEQVHPSVTDALIALRTGGCDAMVHDSPMLEELIRLPEWKKFSARLPAGPRTTLAFLVPAQDRRLVGLLRRVAAEWAAEDYTDALVKNAVRNMAFEVYLEQDVPDCH